MDTINLFLHQKTSLIFVAYVFINSLVSSSTGTKIIPELQLLTRQILFKMKRTVEFDSTVDIPVSCLHLVKRHTRQLDLLCVSRFFSTTFILEILINMTSPRFDDVTKVRANERAGGSQRSRSNIVRKIWTLKCHFLANKSALKE